VNVSKAWDGAKVVTPERGINYSVPGLTLHDPAGFSITSLHAFDIKTENCDALAVTMSKTRVQHLTEDTCRQWAKFVRQAISIEKFRGNPTLIFTHARSNSQKEDQFSKCATILQKILECQESDTFYIENNTNNKVLSPTEERTRLDLVCNVFKKGGFNLENSPNLEKHE